ncbi:hypothetical protein ABPG72_004628 [Tetrahymena utriculariae]
MKSQQQINYTKEGSLYYQIYKNQLLKKQIRKQVHDYVRNKKQNIFQAYFSAFLHQKVFILQKSNKKNKIYENAPQKNITLILKINKKYIDSFGCVFETQKYKRQITSQSSLSLSLN